MSFITNPEIVSLSGTLLAFVGTVVLAFSMGRVFLELRFALDAISTTIESLVAGGNVYVFRGLEQRISAALKASKYPTLIGLFLVAASVPVQGYSLYLSASNTDGISAIASSANMEAKVNAKQLDSLAKEVSSLRLETQQNKDNISVNKQYIENLSDNEKNRISKVNLQLKKMNSDLVEIKQKLEELNNKKM